MHMCVQLLSHVWLFGTPWTLAQQAALSMGLLRWEYWSGLPFPPPGDPPNPGIKPVSPALSAGFLIAEPPGKPARYHDPHQYLVLFSFLATGNLSSISPVLGRASYKSWPASFTCNWSTKEVMHPRWHSYKTGAWISEALFVGQPSSTQASRWLSW